MANRIQLRRGTAAEWAAVNPVLAQGEPGIETDTGKQKFGDGLTVWAGLAYASVGPQGIPGVADDAAVAGLVEDPESDTATALNATYASTAAVAAKANTADVVPKWKATTAYLAGDAVLSPAGDTVTAKVNFTSGASFNAANWNYSASYASAGNAFEAVPFTVYGHSYTNGAGKGVDQGTQFFYRLANRFRTQALVNNGVSGYRMDQILAQIQTTWTPNKRGLIGFGDGVINDVKQFGDAAANSVATTKEAFRSSLAYLTSWAVLGQSSLVYGPGWTNGVSSTAGSYVDVPFSGDSAYVLANFTTDAGGTFTLKNEAGTTLATVATGGFKQAFTGAVKVSGYGAGSHTVRAAVSSGTVGVVGVIGVSPTPPTICWFKAGPYLTVSNAGELGWLATNYQPACASILTDFTTVIPIDVDASWSAASMIAPDGIHPNDAGELYITNLIDKALRGTAARQGLNQLTAPDAGTYPAPAASYVSTTSTVPAQPTGVTAVTGTQIDVAWTRPTDGGATITSQLVEVSLAGANTWSTGATVSAAASSVSVTGLTASTSYDVRVVAINYRGRSAVSSTVTATSGVSVTYYSKDTFNRADGALGTAETGGQTWQTNGATYAIVSNQAKLTAVSGVNNDVFVDDGQAGGRLSVKLVTASAPGQGLAFRLSGTNNATGYLFWQNAAGGYSLSRRTATNTYTLLSATSGVTAAANDVLDVVLSGSSITCKLNGTTVLTATDATYTGTKHGFWGGTTSLNALFDSWSHSDV
jgi:hypothetical protein